MVNDYDRGKIYKIVCNITGEIYVGSTTEPSLARRLAGHKTNYNYYLKGKKNYITSIEIIKNGNYFIELISNAFCNSRDELRAIEGKYIRELNCINKRIAGRSQTQYYLDNSDKIKKYQEDNSEKIKKCKKKYYKDNLDNSKQYYKDNSDKLKQKIICECGGKHTYGHKSAHCKTKKHLNYLKIEL